MTSSVRVSRSAPCLSLHSPDLGALVVSFSRILASVMSRYSATNICLHFPFHLDHDALMSYFSVSDQYCNPDTGNWHEKIYFGSQNCFETKSWWDCWHPRTPVELTFTTDGCISGLSLESCSLSPCLTSSAGESSDSIPEHSYSFV